MTFVPLYVIAFSTTAALITEFLQWFFVWRTPGFKALKANLAKHSKKVDDAKDTAASKNLKKKEQRLQNWRSEAGRQIAAYNWKASLVVSAGTRTDDAATIAHRPPPPPASFKPHTAPLQMMFCMFATYKIMMRLFSTLGPVGRLPFEPPPFLQKVTHRGLESADARDCSAVRGAAAVEPCPLAG